MTLKGLTSGVLKVLTYVIVGIAFLAIGPYFFGIVTHGGDGIASSCESPWQALAGQSWRRTPSMPTLQDTHESAQVRASPWPQVR